MLCRYDHSKNKSVFKTMVNEVLIMRSTPLTCRWSYISFDTVVFMSYLLIVINNTIVYDVFSTINVSRIKIYNRMSYSINKTFLNVTIFEHIYFIPVFLCKYRVVISNLNIVVLFTSHEFFPRILKAYVNLVALFVSI